MKGIRIFGRMYNNLQKRTTMYRNFLEDHFMGLPVFQILLAQMYEGLEIVKEWQR